MNEKLKRVSENDFFRVKCSRW